jgi:hypothetical protein
MTDAELKLLQGALRRPIMQFENATDAAISISIAIADSRGNFNRAAFLIGCGFDPRSKAVLAAREEKRL